MGASEVLYAFTLFRRFRRIVSAFGQTLAMRHYVHSAWTQRDGVPPNILAVEQTKDGYLWMSTEDGLFRFDGVHFERVSSADR